MVRIVILITVIMAVLQNSYAEISERIIAVVNNEIITNRELEAKLQPFYEQYKNVYSEGILEAKIEEMRKQALDDLINDKLVLSESKKKNIEVKKEDIDKEIKKIRARFKDEDEFLAALEGQGITLEELKHNYSVAMMGKRLIDQEIGSKIQVTPSEVYDYYKRNKDEFLLPLMVKVRVITIKIRDDRDNDRARELAESILRRLRRGEDFAFIALQCSDSVYACQSGDMGYIKKGEMMNKIDDTIFNLKMGEISDIVKTDLGYHIFKVEDIKQPETESYDKVSDAIEKKIFMGKFTSRLENYLKKLRESAYIEYK